MDNLKKSQGIWIVCGVACCLLALLTPQIGWFGLSNVAVFLAGAYVFYLASSRTKRLLNSQDAFKKMNAVQKQGIIQLDRQESRNIHSMLSLMLPLLIILNGVLNVYCFFYYSHRTSRYAIFSQIPDSLGLWLLGGDLIFAALFYWALQQNVDEIMKKPEKIARKLEQAASGSNLLKNRKKART